MRLLLPSEVTNAGSLSLKMKDSPSEAFSKYIVENKILVNGAQEMLPWIQDFQMIRWGLK